MWTGRSVNNYPNGNNYKEESYVVTDCIGKTNEEQTEGDNLIFEKVPSRMNDTSDEIQVTDRVSVRDYPQVIYELLTYVHITELQGLRGPLMKGKMGFGDGVHCQNKSKNDNKWKRDFDIHQKTF